ncbi:MAG: hypothetical protein H6839_05200 [Planctomycetes bacterium]|nr:hypothetical protein [Planctomycetota bacterium]
MGETAGEEAPGLEHILALREPLRRIDTVLNFARKLVRESGEVPPGLLADFKEARRDLEKAFVFSFEYLDEKLAGQLRDFLTATKGLDAKTVAKFVDKLSKRARSALNQLMIHGEGPLTLTDELGKVRFTDEELLVDPPQQTPSAAYALMTGPNAIPDAPKASGGAPRMRRALVAVVLIGALAAVALAVGYLAGPWSTTPVYNYSANDLSGGNGGRGNSAPANDSPVVIDDTPFDADAAGYGAPLAVVAAEPTVNPLEVKPDNLTPGELARLMLGYEQLIYTIEPKRLAFPPDETGRRLEKFAKGAVAAEKSWRDERKPMLDAFVEHVRKELQLALYPEEGSQNKLLVSDVLYSVGGGRLSLVLTFQVLAQGCGASTRLIAPNGASRPLLADNLESGVHTFNGESFGLRDGRQPVLILAEMLVELSSRLRPTMDTPEARCLCSAVIQQHSVLFTIDQARAALKDLQPGWLAQPSEDADARTQLVHDLAVRLQPVVCETLLKPIAEGDSEEALAVYRLAEAAGDAERANRALLMLGERAKPGAMLDGEPLPLAVGELLLAQGKVSDADRWFVRAMQEQPADPRPVVRLLSRKEGSGRFDLCREAYTRGERSTGFLRLFAQTAASQSEDLLALKLLDEICASTEYVAVDLQNAVLLCVSLGRTEWGLKRLADHADVVASEPALQRLDLICELSVNGLSTRAKQLAATWRARGQTDAFIESLLKRYGG